MFCPVGLGTTPGWSEVSKVGGRGLATNGTQNTAQNVPQDCVLLLIRGA